MLGRRLDGTWSEEDVLVAQALQQRDTADLVDDVQLGFEALESEATFDRVLFDGGEFGTGAGPGTPEEEEFLGIPGLLDADQVHDLLARAAAGSASRRRLPVPVVDIPALRRELQECVRGYARQRPAPGRHPCRPATGQRRPRGGQGERRRAEGAHRKTAVLGRRPTLTWRCQFRSSTTGVIRSAVDGRSLPRVGRRCSAPSLPSRCPRPWAWSATIILGLVLVFFDIANTDPTADANTQTVCRRSSTRSRWSGCSSWCGWPRAGSASVPLATRSWNWSHARLTAPAGRGRNRLRAAAYVVVFGAFASWTSRSGCPGSPCAVGVALVRHDRRSVVDLVVGVFPHSSAPRRDAAPHPWARSRKDPQVSDLLRFAVAWCSTSARGLRGRPALAECPARGGQPLAFPRRFPVRRSPLVLIPVAAALLLAACGSTTSPTSSPSAASSGSSSPSCSPSSLQTLTPGKFTVGTGNPAYSPWVIDDKPESGKGFEAAVDLRRRQEARLRRRRRRLDAHHLRQRHRTRTEEVRRQHPAVLHLRGAQEGRRLLLRLLRPEPGGRHLQGQPDREGDHRRCAQERQVRRCRRYDVPGRHHHDDPADQRAQGLQQQRRRRRRAQGQADRRARRRPADRLLRRVRSARQRRVGRSAAEQLVAEGAARLRARQGQPAHRVRHPGSRRAA